MFPAYIYLHLHVLLMLAWSEHSKHIVACAYARVVTLPERTNNQ